MPYLIKETHERIEDKEGNKLIGGNKGYYDHKSNKVGYVDENEDKKGNIIERCIQEWGYTDREKEELENHLTDTDDDDLPELELELDDIDDELDEMKEETESDETEGETICKWVEEDGDGFTHQKLVKV